MNSEGPSFRRSRKDLLRVRSLKNDGHTAPEEGYPIMNGDGSDDTELVQSPFRDFRIDERCLIDPKLLFVGPRIGVGSHGKVYEGKYGDTSVALKLIQPGNTPEERVKRESRFVREVSLLCKMQHKNLVQFIGACKEPTIMVVVTELVQGGSLRKFMMSMRPSRLDQRLAIKFALDIAEAMEYLHTHGVIHRDLKPDNLLLTTDQKTVKLIDFGLAREETLTEMMTAETGTYRWMAPELYSTVTLRNGEKKHYNHKVDVYSFSIVLWELITNRMPFEGMSNLQAAYAAAFKGTRPSVGESMNIPEELALILQSCWAEDPNARPNFSQVVPLLNAYMLKLPAPEHIAPQLQVVSNSIPLPKEHSSSSSTKPNTFASGGNPGTTINSRCSIFGCCGFCM